MTEIVQTGMKRGRTEEVALPDGVTASMSGRTLTMKGPKGESSKEMAVPDASISIEGNKALISSSKSSKREKKILGSLRAHIVNMVRGVNEGHVYKLKVCFTHFPITVTVTGRKLLVKNFLGEKTPRALDLAENVKVKVEGADVTIESSSKEAAGQAAGSLEQLTKRANYDKRVFGDGIYITMKDGKEIK